MQSAGASQPPRGSMGVRTSYGVPLAPDERVVFAFVPPPVSGGERAVIVLIGLFFLPVVVGVFIIAYAFMKKSDRAWLITSQRVINVNAKGAFKAIALGDIALAARSKASGSIELRYGVETVSVPLRAEIGGVHMLDAVRTPQAFANLPGIDTPP